MAATVAAGALGVTPVRAADAVPTPTVVASGAASVKPTPTDAHDDAAIRRAVDAAVATSLPRAVQDARDKAQALAGAAGGTLGVLVSVSNEQPSTFPYFISSPQSGTFGNGHFCGKVPNFKTVTTAQGLRRRVRTKGTHKVCRVPSAVSSSVTLTYTLLFGVTTA